MSLPTSSGRLSLAPVRRQGPNVAAGIAAPGFSDPPLGASAWNVNLASLKGCFSRKARHDDAEDHEHPDVGLFTVNMLAPALKFKRRSEHESALESLRATKRVCTTDEPVTAGAVGGAEGGIVTGPVPGSGPIQRHCRYPRNNGRVAADHREEA